MAGSDARHGRRFVLVLVLALVIAGAVLWRSGRIEPYLDRVLEPDPAADPGTGPAAISPPEGLDLPAMTDPRPVADPLTGSSGVPRTGAVRRALGPYLRDDDLGSHVLAVVTDAMSGEEVYRKGNDAAIPASTTKVATAAAALLTLGPETTFTTTVVAGGPGTVVLVGGGDPFLQRAPDDAGDPEGAAYPPRADVTSLARQTANALLASGSSSVQVGYDASLFTGPGDNPAWKTDYVRDGVVSPISALWVDEGRAPDGFGRVADPALAAAQEFAVALSAAGVGVTGSPTAAVAAPTGQPLAVVQSAPLREIVQRVLETSDNEGAEVLARQVALARGLPGSFEGGASAVVAALGELGVTSGVTVYDGSGLSRQNRIDPAALVAILRATTDPAQPRLATLLPGLPVAGFTGSLADRFAAAAPEGRGTVRAKTGTLSGVTSLAGTVVDAAGHPYFFALMADRVAPPDETLARDALDGASAALGACVCSR